MGHFRENYEKDYEKVKESQEQLRQFAVEDFKDADDREKEDDLKIPRNDDLER